MLNDVLTAELTAVKQYFIHARMCENWGYERLWKKVREESIGEMRYAYKLIGRILYLEGIPNLQRLGKVNVGKQGSTAARRAQSSSTTTYQEGLKRNVRRAQGGPHKRTRRVVAGP